MSDGEAFFDTNVLLYLMSADTAKSDRAEALIAEGGVIGVQVLNEFVAVAARKLAMSLSEIREVLAAVRAACRVEPLSVETHELALDLMDRFHLSVYDALICAAAALAKCRVLYSEDMQDGQTIAGVVVRNPFAGRPA
jgi:predicted nucleic acid-binding protein